MYIVDSAYLSCVASLRCYNLLWFSLLLQYIVILVAWPEKLDASYFHQYNLLKNDNRLYTDYIYPFQYRIAS